MQDQIWPWIEISILNAKIAYAVYSGSFKWKQNLTESFGYGANEFQLKCSIQVIRQPLICIH